MLCWMAQSAEQSLAGCTTVRRKLVAQNGLQSRCSDTAMTCVDELKESVIMKAFLLACVSAVIIAIIGVVVLNSIQDSADQAFTTSAVRLGK
jgi:hypothetical protein